MKGWLLAWTVGCLLTGSHAVAQDSCRIAAFPPLRSLQITSPFGYRTHPVTGIWQFHNGVDLRARADTVFVVMDGMVVQTGYDSISGIFIKVAHSGELTSVYAHLSVPWVFAGEVLTADQPIALSGCTGRTTGEHLHFSILYDGRYINPIKFLSKILIP